MTDTFGRLYVWGRWEVSMQSIVRFRFANSSTEDAIEDDLALAVFASECIYGRPRTRLEMRYLVSPDGASCVAEVGGPAGEAVLCVFMGLVGVRCGEGSVSVERIVPDREHAPAGPRP